MPSRDRLSAAPVNRRGRDRSRGPLIPDRRARTRRPAGPRQTVVSCHEVCFAEPCRSRQPGAIAPACHFRSSAADSRRARATPSRPPSKGARRQRPVQWPGQRASSGGPSQPTTDRRTQTLRAGSLHAAPGAAPSASTTTPHPRPRKTPPRRSGAPPAESKPPAACRRTVRGHAHQPPDQPDPEGPGPKRGPNVAAEASCLYVRSIGVPPRRGKPMPCIAPFTAYCL